MSRRKVNQTVAKQPVKKTPAKRAPKSQQTTVIAQEDLILASVAHEESVAVTHVETNVSLEDKETVVVAHEETVVAHEEATATHHAEPNESVESSKGIVESIIAFKKSNETQFYGIVAIAVFVLIILL